MRHRLVSGDGESLRDPCSAEIGYGSALWACLFAVLAFTYPFSTFKGTNNVQ